MKYAAPSQAIKPSDMKRSNRVHILELFKSGGAWSANALSESTGLSRQTIMKAIQFFVEKGIIVPDGKASSGPAGGKRAELYSLSSDQYLFSVLICPDYLYISLFNYRCEVIDSFTQYGIAGMGVDEVISAAGTACYKLLLDNGLPRDRVRGLCVSSSGIVDHRSNLLRFNSLLPGWGRDIPIARRLSEFFDGQALVVAENVGKVCGSAYLHDPRFQGKRGMTLFSSWGGVCACMMEGGRILHGKDALIGEIGHMTLDPDDDERCGCGGHGCFERQVDDRRIQRHVLELATRYPASPLRRLPLEEVTVKRVFEASEQDDPMAAAIVDRLARCFALALRNVTLLFNPDLVVLQGDYADADARFHAILQRELGTFNYYNAPRPFEIEADRRGIRDVTTLGAYTLLIDGLFSDEAVYQ